MIELYPFAWLDEDSQTVVFPLSSFVWKWPFPVFRTHGSMVIPEIYTDDTWCWLIKYAAVEKLSAGAGSTESEEVGSAGMNLRRLLANQGRDEAARKPTVSEVQVYLSPMLPLAAGGERTPINSPEDVVLVGHAQVFPCRLLCISSPVLVRRGQEHRYKLGPLGVAIAA